MQSFVENQANQSATLTNNWHLLPLSANTETGLEVATAALLELLRTEPAPSISELACALRARGTSAKQRLGIVCRDGQDALRALSGQRPQDVFTSLRQTTHDRVIFMFPGGGTQYPDMGLELYREEPVFRRHIDLCSEILEPKVGFDLREILYPTLSGKTDSAAQLNVVTHMLPALFATEYALAQLWMSWGIRPAAMIGHSLGEYVAACLSGVISLEDALSLVALRGRLLHDLPPGSMLSIQLTEEEVKPLLKDGLSLAAVNSPQLCVVSGPRKVIEELEKSLSEKGVEARLLRISTAGHSQMVEPILEEFTSHVCKIEQRTPSIPYISNVTGSWITSAEVSDKDYWARHLRLTVRFAQGAQTLLKSMGGILLEVGPGQVLSTLLRQLQGEEDDRLILPSMRHPHEQESDLKHLLNTLGKIWAGGVDVDWSGFDCQQRHTTLALPEQLINPDEHAENWDGESLVSIALQSGEAGEGSAPRNDIERQIQAVWEEMLGKKQIGIHDNFFHLGGHSLLATRIFSRLASSFNVSLPLRSLFEAPTIASLASLLSTLLDSPSDAALPPIPIADRSIPLPLSFAQQRLWFIEQMQPGSAAYNVTRAFSLCGALDIPALELSLSEIIRRHEPLRTHFSLFDSQPVQIIDPPFSVHLPVEDLSHLPDPHSAAAEAARQEASTGFDLERGPVIRLRLLRLSDNEHVLLLSVHHIAFDGWSTGVLVRELRHLYAAFREGRQHSLPEPPVSYADYAVWQRQWLSGSRLDEQLDYWREQLKGAPAVLELPSDRSRPAVRSERGARQRVEIGAELVERLREVGRREGATLYMMLLAGWKALLMRYSGEREVVVGTPVAGRGRGEVEGLIGLFINMVAVRTRVEGGERFEELVRKVKESALGAYGHQELPFERLVEELQPERSLSHTPLFQVVFAPQNVPFDRMEAADLSLQLLEPDCYVSKYDLALFFNETASGAVAWIEYSTDLYEEETISRMLSHYLNLLSAAAVNPSLSISRLPLLTTEQRRALLSSSSAPVYRPLPSTTVIRLFERQVELSPDALALLCGTRSLTYRELNRRANRLARQLRRSGVGAEQRVGILAERSVELVVAAVAVLKAGGAYVPLDPAYPRERLQYMMRDAGLKVLLIQDGLRPEAAAAAAAAGGEGMEVISLKQHAENSAHAAEASESDDQNLMSMVDQQNLAYIIYTSGSTGKPKAVELSLRSLLNLISWHHRAFSLSSADRSTLLAGPSFDASVWELWPYLCSGAALCIPPRDVLLSPANLIQWMRQHQITISFLPTPLAEAVIEQHEREGWPEGLRLRALLTGGDRLRRAPIEPLPFSFYNNYGPTEATVVATMSEVEAGGEGAPPVGRAIDNAEVYVLDERMELVPEGVVGEVYIGGEGLARGYLGRAGLTAERFVPDALSGRVGGRLYRSGDKGRRAGGEELEVVGRADGQVKVRGYRVEVGEVESALMEHEDVSQAVVVLNRGGKDASDARLVAYVVSGLADVASISAELRSHLQSKLPDYMIPTHFVSLDALPLTANGKVDRRALPEIDYDQQASDNPYVAPRTPLEETLAAIWEEMLGKKQIGIHDNFFHLGGHSLLATRIFSRLASSFNVSLPLRSLFEAPTIASLASLLSTLLDSPSDAALPPITAADRSIPLPLSFAQQRLWFIEQMQPGSAAYNVTRAFSLCGALDIRALELSLSEIIRRHEPLRTHFSLFDSQPIQIIDPPSPVSLHLEDLSHLPDPHSAAAEAARQEASTGFDLEHGPVIRLRLLRLSDNEHVLLLSVHHIAFDGWSTGVLVRELRHLYAAFREGRQHSLPEPPVSYADYAVWQRQWLSGSRLDEQLDYWREQLKGAPAVLELPSDHSRPVVRSERGARQRVEIGAELVERLREVGRREGATLYMVLLAGWKALLMRYSGEREVVVGTPVAGRGRGEVEGLIGLFINMVAVRTRVEGGERFEELVRKVKESALGAYGHQELPFERLVEEMGLERDLSRNPIFQVVFALQNVPAETFRAEGLTVRSLDVETRVSKFDISLYLNEEDGKLIGQVEYSTDLYEEETISRMLSHYLNLLSAAAVNPSLSISRLPLLTTEQRRALLSSSAAPVYRPLPSTTVIRLFERQVELSPDALALLCGTRSLTYRELNRRANRLARQLRRSGVGAEQRVGILAERSVELVVGAVAVLKAGGAYVPLDPAYPRERLQYMMRDAGLRVLLAQEQLAESWTGAAGGEGMEVISLKLHAENSADAANGIANTSDEDDQNLMSMVDQQNLAYIIYTSGSTGKPKAVELSLRSLLNLISWHHRAFSLSSADRSTLLAGPSFDASVWELWPYLCSGAALCIPPRDVLLSPANLIQWMRQHQITISFLPTPLAEAVIEQHEREGWPEGLRLRALLTGGDRLRRAPIEPLPFSFYNNYGPTEATVVATMSEVEAGGEGAPPVGRAIDNAEVYVLDERMELVPEGVVGEVYIGGEGLARGYLGRAGLTAERFVPDALSGRVGGRLYRSGDKGRRVGGGELEVVGRADGQVKVRGYRVEVGEVESALMEHEDVSQAVVMVREDAPGDKRLVAYVVSSPGRSVNVVELRTELKKMLPDYMVPTAFVNLEKLPLTPNGKVDRKALPAPEPARSETENLYVAPHSALEQMISDVWSRVLKIDKVGVGDNFFDLGGHSLAMVKVHDMLQESLKQMAMNRKVELVELFEHPTVSALAKHLGHEESEQNEMSQVKGRARKQKQALSRQSQLARAASKKQLQVELN